MLDTWENTVDAIFVVTRFKQKAVLEVTLGSKQYKIDCEPGITQHQLNWDSNKGKPDFKVKRNDQVIIHAKGILEITDNPQDSKGEFTRNIHQYAFYAETSWSVMVK